ncbi:MAG: acyltransferase [Gammaproteobacteria bacterium]|nr:MAG: acyltransferase [Gammaproteobacteria bacterium]
MASGRGEDGPAPPWAAARLGRDREVFHLEGRQALAEGALTLARQARRGLELHSRELDPALYGSPAFVEAVKALCLRGPRVQVRILLEDPRPAVQEGHRLVELAHRLPSRVRILRPEERHLPMEEEYLLADGTGLLHRLLAARHQGRLCLHAPLEVRRLQAAFEERWQIAEPHPDLRRLHL